MRKFFILFGILLICFFGNIVCVEAETIYLDDENYMVVNEGDVVCDNTYAYKAVVYDYKISNDSFSFLGNLSITDGIENYQRCVSLNFDNLYENGLEHFDTDKFVVYSSSDYEVGFAVYPYYFPKVSISCDKDNIKYGEKSECNLYYETKKNILLSELDKEVFVSKENCIGQLNFNFSNDVFNVLDYSSDFHLKKTDNNYSIIDTSGTCSCDEKNVMLRFTVTPVNEEVAGTDLKISADNLSFVDSGSVSSKSDVSTNLGVSKDTIKNPETFSNIEVYIAVLIVIISLIGIYFLSKKLNMKKID